MKPKFLDARNCHALLPTIRNLSTIRKLDDCLLGINNSSGKLSGSIDLLIHQNEKTRDQIAGSKRFCFLPIQIALRFFISKNESQITAITGPESQYAQFHLTLEFENGLMWKTLIPLQFLLKGWGEAEADYQCYIHIIAQNMDKISSLYHWDARRNHDSDEYFYVGITGRNWLTRLSEHIGEIHRGSRKRFHSAWRDSLGLQNVIFFSVLKEVNLSYEEAMNWEETYVDKIAYGPQGLNMIPGGFKGIRYLHKLRIINHTNISLDERDTAIEKYIRENPRKGIPNPFISELWKDDDFYLKVIEARPKTLSPEQVRNIRELSKTGMQEEEIVELVNALNIIQVKNVLTGKTYKRIE